MNNLDYGYPSSNNSSFSSSFSSQYSSTPSNIRYQRPRFAYSGPPSYPRPRSSASKPNPDSYYSSMLQTDYPTDLKAPMSGVNSSNSYQNSTLSNDYSHGYSDSMRNNYGDSTMLLNDSVSNSRDAYGNSSSYFTANESFYDSPQKSLSTNYQTENSSFGLSDRGGHSSFGINSNRSNSYFNPNAEQFSVADKNFRSNPAIFNSSNTGPAGSYGINTRGNRGNFRGRFQKKSASNKGSSMGPKTQWHCAICSIDFTSQIPLEMHLRGSRHAKKLKTQSALDSITGQNSQFKEVDKADGKKFVCEVCNIIANSSLQLQMHLDGTKHKAKMQQRSEPKDDSKGESDKKESEVNGKGNESIVRALPADFGNPQPTKMAKFSCDVCGIVVNSEVQLQQHLSSKKHQAKVEGKPIVKKKKAPKQDDEAQAPMEQDSTEAAEKPEITNVVGVKTLSASFVQGGTLQ